MTCDFLWCRRASMELTVEQRYAVKVFFFFNSVNPRLRSLNSLAYGDDAISPTRVFELHKMFKEGRELVERPTTARTDAQVAKVKKVLDSDRLHLTFSCFRE